MKNVTNPFSVTSYMGSEYFCDRKQETYDLSAALYNRRNVTLISPRRIGKTGLIQHVFEAVKPKEAHCFYVDLFSTSNLADFTKKFTEAVLTKQITPFSERVWNDITRIFGALRPVFSPDPLTGMLKCTIDLQPQREEWTLQQIFAYLEKANIPCYVAFDEFQTIAEYKDCKMEALLRGYIQQLNNVRFIFAGSKKHVMMQMFAAANRPFFQSTQIMNIDVIDEKAYYQFATRHFAKHNQLISKETFHELYTLVDGYTWYMQAMLNRLYQDGAAQIDDSVVVVTLNQLLQESEPTYQMYSRLLTERQLQVLRAIAKEGEVKEPGSSSFLQKNNLGAYSTVRSAIATMVEKELVYQKDNGAYIVYNKFFGLWLKQSDN